MLVLYLQKTRALFLLATTARHRVHITVMKNGLNRAVRRDSKGGCSLAIHAEQNAILYAVKNKTSVDGATLYVTLSPCLACSRIIFSMGIRRVIYLNSYAEFKGLASDEGVDFLNKFGVECLRYAGTLTNVTHMI
jgi:dCMP deaminase